jgi:hypothetical protein
MRGFWTQRRKDEIEGLLRAHRAEPRDEFVASLLERLETRHRIFRPHPAGRRVLVAAVVTAVALGAGIALGGAHVAGTSISNLVRVGQSSSQAPKNTPNSNTNGNNTNNGNDNNGGDQQYSVPVCHHTGSRTNPWIELFLSPEGAANHVKHHPPDYIVGQDGNPDTCPP